MNSSSECKRKSKTPELYFEPEREEPPTPFVLNDEVLTDEVLEAKIYGRVIGDDMLPSLSEIPNEQ